METHGEDLMNVEDHSNAPINQHMMKIAGKSPEVTKRQILSYKFLKEHGLVEN